MVFEKSIAELIDENYVYARALNYLGIDFIKYADVSLDHLIALKGLKKDTIINTFYLFDSPTRLSLKELEAYPIQLLTQYLKHNHSNFIKDKLPFIVDLARKSITDKALSSLLPEFIEDLIKHIYEEEDSIFRYVELLQAIHSGKGQINTKQILDFKELSLRNEYEKHLEVDDFGSIRTLVQNFDPKNLGDRVLVNEVHSFDREMIYHSEIENRIFFPKALKLEEDVFHQINNVSRLN